MKELKLAEVDAKKLGLVLEDDKGQQYFLAYSKEIHAASTDIALSSSSSPDNSRSAGKSSKPSDLSPREIQQRVRSGMSAQEIHERFNISLDKVHRYSIQVEREKAIIVEQFQHLPARSEKKGMDLLGVVNEYFDENDIDRKAAKWLSLRDGRDPWTIRLYFRKGTAVLSAIWSWDSKEQVISEDNLIAREITKYHLDAKPDEEITHLGKSTKRSKPSTNGDYNPKLINISNSMRLRELKKLRDELDHDLKVVHDINISEENVSTNEPANSKSDSDTDTSTKKTASGNTKPNLKVIKNEAKSAGLALKTGRTVKPKMIAKVDEDEDSGNKNNGGVVKKAEASSTSKATSEIQDLNITGKLRAKFGRTSTSKRKNVPAWDEVMISNFEESDDQSNDS